MNNKNKIYVAISIIILFGLIVTFAILGNNNNEKPIKEPDKTIENIETETKKEPFKPLEDFIYINDKFYYLSNIDINNNSHIIGEEIGKIEYLTSSRENEPGILDNIQNGTASYLELNTTVYKIIGDSNNSMIACNYGPEMVVYTLKDVEVPEFISKTFIYDFTFENIIELSNKKDSLNWDELISMYNLEFENDKTHIFTSIINGNFMLIISGNKNDNNIEIYIKNIYTNKVYNIFDNDVNLIFGIDTIETRNANFMIESIDDEKNFKIKLLNECYKLTVDEIYNARFFDDGQTTNEIKIGTNINIDFVVRMEEIPVLYVKTMNIIE